MKKSNLLSFLGVLGLFLLIHIPLAEAVDEGYNQSTNQVSKKAQSQSLSVIQGETVTKKYYGKLESRASKAVVIDAKTRRALPKNQVQAIVEPGSAIIKDRSGKVVLDKNGKPRKKSYAQVTIKTTSNVRPGTYQILMLDQRGKPLSYKDSNTQRIVKVAPKNLIVMASDGAKKSQTISNKSAGSPSGSTNVPLIYSRANVPDINKRVIDYERATQIVDRMNQFGKWVSLQDFTSLGNAASPWGIGPGLVNTATDLRKGMIDKLGFWPSNSSGTIGADGSGGFDAGMVQNLDERVSLTNPAKTGTMSSGRAGDPRLMTGDTGGTGGDDKGTDDETAGDKESGDKGEEISSDVTTSDSDKESSDGSSTQTSTVNVDNSDGSKLAHTVTQSTSANGSTKTTQSIYYKDKNGNVTTYHTSTDNNGNTKTSCNGQLCTPDPESSSCRGSGCESFNQWTALLMGNLNEYGIKNMQTDAGSMMQPAGVGSRSGSIDSLRSGDRDLYQRTLNPYILHDNAGSGGAPRIDTGPTIRMPVTETFVDPPEPEIEQKEGAPPKTR